MNRPRGKPFEVGNKFGRGRPKGSRNKRNAECLKLLNQYSVAVVSKCLGKALDGDDRALRLCYDSIVSTCRDSSGSLKLPELRELKDVDRAMEMVLIATASKKISATHGQKLLAMLLNLRDTFRNREIEARLSALEMQHSSSLPGQGNVDAPNETA